MTWAAILLGLLGGHWLIREGREKVLRQHIELVGFGLQQQITDNDRYIRNLATELITVQKEHNELRKEHEEFKALAYNKEAILLPGARIYMEKLIADYHDDEG